MSSALFKAILSEKRKQTKQENIQIWNKSEDIYKYIKVKEW